jgi:hypothetical protein
MLGYRDFWPERLTAKLWLEVLAAPRQGGLRKFGVEISR